MLLGSLKAGPSSPSRAQLIPLLPARGRASDAELLILEKGRLETPNHCQNEDQCVKIERRWVPVKRTESVCI